MPRKKLLLDTDIGSDIDDAVCLAYLLAQPDCDLMGITTVSGEPEKRAMLASVLCGVAGRSVPIFPGAATPLFTAQRQTTAPQACALGRWPHRSSFPRGQAIEYLRQTIRAHPGEVVLLTIGPLTNVALLFAVDPEIPSMLKSLVMMCGHFTAPQPEWNAMLDPHAAALVYRAEVGAHRSIGLDVTRKVTLAAEEVRRRFQGTLLAPVLDFAGVWFERNEKITFHDPLAAATIFDAGVCTFTTGSVMVELDGGGEPGSPTVAAAGKTRWKRDDVGGRHQVALEVDAKRFFDHFFSVF
jgi:purine nucleosidase